MEKDKLFVNAGSPPPPNYWQQSSSGGIELQLGELNCAPEQLPVCFLNLNLENSTDQSVPFESALSSMVSSPAASNAAVPADSIVIRELIGRLGSICNSGEISPRSQMMPGAGQATFIGGNNSTNTSCYSTPLNSPPKFNLSLMDQKARGNPLASTASIAGHPSLAPLAADPGFAERAAKFSCFSNGNYGQFVGPPEAELPYRPSLQRMESGKLSRVSSSQSLKVGSQVGVPENKEIALQDGLEVELRSASASGRKLNQFSRSSTPDNGEFGNGREESSSSHQSAGGEARDHNEMNGRKRKAAPKSSKPKQLPTPLRDTKMQEGEDSSAKRCKAGEAAGKNVVKPKTEQNSSGAEDNDKKKEKESNAKAPEPPKDYIHVRARRGQATDSHSLAERVRREKISERMKFLQDLVPGCNKVTGKAVMLDEIINYVQSLQRQVEFLSMKLATVNPRLDIDMENLLSKDLANLWDDDLQSVVQMGFGQNQEMAFPPQGFHGSFPTSHMKVEM
ncbi:hypothetical protein ACLOJK_008175 [Asimina triloba]